MLSTLVSEEVLAGLARFLLKKGMFVSVVRLLSVKSFEG
jgi:hypothetical protein